ncbi:AcrR family transcriptional regulator [Actinopolyspora biskrensis]|uniref:AcrR family transcriptional regulator n=1 Tax=Actinopolyspora biskrensis TaxID=1470178 RepID=A0A852Z5S5_9ACTN|nr:TetR/AcrR family transcriptional regulator [Actinopolyspora biskrensis]NYH77563.1 AcrR family transcriptional regulator [Actinopolyspora biskrensis]
MVRQSTEVVRERVLNAAADLFDRYGVHAVGLQRVIDEVGCGKYMLYREFPSKDDLIVAYLRRSCQYWDQTLDSTRATTTRPEEQLIELVRTVSRQVPGTRGCPLRNTYAEFPEHDHPARQVALEHFSLVRQQLGDIARQTGAPEPDRLAERILLIINGLYSPGHTAGPEDMSEISVTLARDIVAVETGKHPTRDQSGQRAEAR